LHHITKETRCKQVSVRERDRLGTQFPEPVTKWLLSEETDTA
jgi:hypothetical protein